MVSTLLGGGGEGLEAVQKTGAVTVLNISAVTAAFVRLVPWAWVGAPALRAELYTPCVFAEYFGWQAGRGISNGVLNTSGTDWTLNGLIPGR